jgi:uncharacterized membrane protein YqjE
MQYAMIVMALHVMMMVMVDDGTRFVEKMAGSAVVCDIFKVTSKYAYRFSGS